MEVSKLGFWALLTLPFYRSVTWQASLSELGSRGVPSFLVRLLWILLFPIVAFSRTDDDYAIMDVAPDLGDCIWSLGTFSLLAGFVTLPIFAIIDGIPMWLSGLLILGWPVFKFLSIPFTRRQL
ncbi:hypothetical protein MARLIPOL_18273 [Marinobacter lipolyticus SM19]|uniref:Uncharacterized protein n=1 Tax=Marinobacter lipolyticus SM19 TaxID=1318628 RepID=R8AW25_9GAMM|nr:hypothetical protein MARLIPOL_18273 [Marinobacter lipolyticus SM19]